MKIYKIKKVNIHFQRKMALFYSRTILIIKYSVIIFLFCVFFTSPFSFIKDAGKDFFFEISGKAGFKFENLVIEGIENIPEAKILEALGAKVNDQLFKINIKNVKKKLAQDPWVKAVAVKRELPNTIRVILIENTPIAKWQINNKLYLINADGQTLSEGHDEKFSYLPHIVGKGANLYGNKLLKDLKRYPELSAKIISAVRYGQRRWDLNFVQNITVKMPENDFNAALEYLNKLNNQNKFFNQNYKILDLRDSDKFYTEKYS